MTRRQATTARGIAGLALALALCGPSPVARAEEPAAVEPATGPAPDAGPAPAAEPEPALPIGSQDSLGRAGLALHQRIGEAIAPFHATAFPQASSRDGQAATSVFTGYFQPAADLWIGVRVPIAAVAVEQPAGAHIDEAAWGNPELYGEHRSLRWSDARLRLFSAARVSVGLPLAEHGPAGSLMQSRALAVADALQGWADQELFTPGVFPLAASGRLDLALSRWVFSAGAKLPLFIRVSDADLPEESTTNAVGFAPLVEARASVWPWRSVGLSLGGHAVFNALPVTEPPPGADSPGVVQLVVEPRLLFAIRSHFLLTVDAVIPAGGALGGNTAAFGMHALGYL